MKHSLDELVTAITLLFGPIPAKQIVGKAQPNRDGSTTYLIDGLVELGDGATLRVNALNQLTNDSQTVDYANRLAKHMEEVMHFSPYEADLFVRNFFAAHQLEAPSGYVEKSFTAVELKRRQVEELRAKQEAHQRHMDLMKQMYDANAEARGMTATEVALRQQQYELMSQWGAGNAGGMGGIGLLGMSQADMERWNRQYKTDSLSLGEPSPPQVKPTLLRKITPKWMKP